jgi:hypothetical protein
MKVGAWRLLLLLIAARAFKISFPDKLSLDTSTLVRNYARYCTVDNLSKVGGGLRTKAAIRHATAGSNSVNSKKYRRMNRFGVERQPRVKQVPYLWLITTFHGL